MGGNSDTSSGIDVWSMCTMATVPHSVSAKRRGGRGDKGGRGGGKKKGSSPLRRHFWREGCISGAGPAATAVSAAI